VRLIAAGAAALLLAGCGATPHRFELAGSDHALHWWLPDGPAARLVVLAPGFARRCTHLQGLARDWAAEGMRVLCLDAPMAGGAPDTAAALAGWLAAGLPAPTGGEQAARVVVAGHSAGGAFALHLGARLQALAPARLAGVLLFDAVPGSHFAADLGQLAEARVPLLALTATPHACNANAAAWPVLAAARDGGAPLELDPPPPGSTHADVEGDDTDALAVAACGRPDAALVQRLHQRASAWLAARR